MTRRGLAVCLSVAAAAACRPAPPPTPAPTLTKLRLSYRAVLSHAPLVIADAGGYFRRHGLEVEFVRMQRSKDALPALIAGEVDVLAGYVSPSFLNSMARGAPIRIVADKGYNDPAGCSYESLLTLPALLKDGRLREPVPKRPWRLSARSGSLNEYMADLALAKAGIPAGHVDKVSLDAASEGESLRNGAVDVVVASGLTDPRRGGDFVTWYGSAELAPELSMQVMLFGPSLLQKNPEAGRRFVLAYLEAARQYAQGKTERNLRIVSEGMGYERDSLERSCWIPVRADGRPDLPSLERFEEWSFRRGLLDRRLQAAEYWDPQFVDAANRALATAPSGPAAR